MIHDSVAVSYFLLSVPIWLYLSLTSLLYLIIYIWFQGIRSQLRTSSGMFVSTEERKYPMIQVWNLTLILWLLTSGCLCVFFIFFSYDKCFPSDVYLIRGQLVVFNFLETCIWKSCLIIDAHDQAIEKRISVYSQVPVENGERIQVLRWVLIYRLLKFIYQTQDKI